MTSSLVDAIRAYAQRRVRRLAEMLCSVMCVFLAAPCTATVFWQADATGVTGFDAAGQRVARVDMDAVERLAVAHDGAVWIISPRGVSLISADARRVVAALDPVSRGFGRPTEVAVDPVDDSAWIATSDDLLLRVGRDGRVLQGVTIPVAARALGVALDRSVWAVGEGLLMQVSQPGAVTRSIALGARWPSEAGGLLIDSLRDRTWLVGKNALARVTPTDSRPSTIFDIDAIEDATLDPVTGALWVIAEGRLLVVGADDPAGTPFTQFVSGEASQIVYDAGGDQFLLQSDRGVTAIERTGRALWHVEHDPAGMKRVAGLPFQVVPSVTLVRPPDASSLLEARPVVQLHVGTLCNGRPCDLPTYIDSTRWNAKLNGRIFASEVAADVTTGIVPLKLPMDLRPGDNRLVAWGIDRFGRASAEADATWTRLDGLQARVVEKAPNQRPAVSLTAPGNGAQFIPGAAVAIAASASDPDGTVAKVEFFQGAALLGIDTSAPYAWTWNNVAAGAYALTARATDNKGATTVSAAVNIVVAAPANNAPSVTVANPSEGASFAAGASVQMQVVASDPDGSIARIDFFDGASFRGSVAGNAATQPASWTFAGLTAGSHTLRATAVDNAGASASASINVMMATAPLVVMAAPPMCVDYGAPASFTLRAEALSPDGTIASVAFYRDDTPIGTSAAEPYLLAINNLGAGRHTFIAKATDDRGVTATSAPLVISVASANAPPAVSIVQPAEGAQVAAGAMVVITAAASDPDSQIARVEFLRGGVPIGRSNSPPYSINWVATPPGNQSLTAVAIDTEGASTTSQPIHVVVTNAPPVVTLTTPADGAGFVAPATINLNAYASDSDGTIASVEFLAGSTRIGFVTSPPYTAAWTGVTTGTYQLTAKATDNFGAAATSAPVTVSVTTNSTPSVALTSPANNSTYSSTSTIQLVALASDVDGVIAQVEFYQGATSLGRVGALPYVLSWANPPPGTHVLTAKATDNAGAMSTSTPVTVSITANDAPTVAITSPISGATYFAPATVHLMAAASDGQGIASVEYFDGTTRIGSATTAPYAYIWDNVGPGAHLVTAVARDPSGASTTSAAVAITVQGAIAMTIRAGIDGSTVHDDVVTVSGTVSAPPNSGLSVNGRLAQVDGAGNFVIDGLALVTGQNSITLIATSQDGQTASQTIAVSSTGPASFAVSAAPAQGLAPLDTRISVVNRAGVPFKHVEFDFDGNGTIDYVAPASAFVDVSFELTLTYPAGRWPVTTRVRDDADAVIFEATNTIDALAPMALEAKVRGVFTGMLDRLRAGNLSGALSAVTDTVYEKYSEIFGALQGSMSNVIDQLGSIEEVALTDDIVEYALVRNTSSGPQRFLVYLLRGADGIWRVEGM